MRTGRAGKLCAFALRKSAGTAAPAANWKNRLRESFMAKQREVERFPVTLSSIISDRRRHVRF